MTRSLALFARYSTATGEVCVCVVSSDWLVAGSWVDSLHKKFNFGPDWPDISSIFALLVVAGFWCFHFRRGGKVGKGRGGLHVVGGN